MCPKEVCEYWNEIVYDSIVQKYAQCVLLFFSDLMADPTLCRTTGNEWHFNLKDIARQSNETSVLSVFGQSSGISLFMTLDNFNSSKYYYLCKQLYL